jgi:hypothetical protein
VRFLDGLLVNDVAAPGLALSLVFDLDPALAFAAIHALAGILGALA